MKTMRFFIFSGSILALWLSPGMLSGVAQPVVAQAPNETWQLKHVPLR